MRTAERALGWLAAVAALAPPVAADATPARVLDAFESAQGWEAVGSDSVSARLHTVAGAHGRALCLEYDFNGVAGYAVARRRLPIRFPGNYRFRLHLRGEGPRNNLEIKFVDAGGDNVWWFNRPDFAWPAAWTPLAFKKRHIEFAWGPAADRTLRESAHIELTVSAREGGRGRVCLDELHFEPLPPDATAPLRPLGDAASTGGAQAAARAVDGSRRTAWRVSKDGAPALVLDFGAPREFGGLILRWAPGAHASRYAVDAAGAPGQWREIARVEHGNGGFDALALPESEARLLRLRPRSGPGTAYALEEIEVKPLGFAATPNDFIRALAAEHPRGQFPRGFHGEQPYWTLLGVDGGPEQGLLGEDGAVEVARGRFSVEPFVVVDGKLLTWADVRAEQSLLERHLPIPSVHWRHADAALDITAFAHGDAARSRLVARYRLTNPGRRPRDYVLVLAARPFQVNPPTQFLNTRGGVAPIREIAAEGRAMRVDGRTLRLSQPFAGALLSPFDAGEIVERLRAEDWSRGCVACRQGPRTAASERTAGDPRGLASGAVLFPVRLAPGASFEVDWRTPLSGEPAEGPAVSAARLQQETAAFWRERLGAVRIQVPDRARHAVDTLRTALAHMLMSRAGPRLQPGTRSYARAWIRDGAMIAEGLLRLGRADVAEAFLRWYAPYQFPDGKVPCCVDDRGSDPVPENDSHGQLIYTVAEIYRYTRDERLLRDMWPHVEKAVAYMDRLRLSERTGQNRRRNPAFYGLMPASISHEGYSAKPMHSYWDDFWALRGYKDAVAIARWLGRERDAARIAASRDRFRADLYASLGIAMRQHGIDYLPGAAELGDFDATSTTIALAPGGEQGRLPEAALRATFERYWRQFVERRDGRRAWKDYTPYELRTVGTFVRLGWRDRAHEALRFFFADQQPRGWNQWAEVVSRTPRTPFFLGDLPHAWVESDYVRSLLDMFAYEREHDAALVLAAGIPRDWLEGEGVAVHGLRTPHGPLSYRLREADGRVRLELAGGLDVPPGGLVLAWPTAMRGHARIDGVPVPWQGGELRIARVPAVVEFEAAPAGAPPR